MSNLLERKLTVRSFIAGIGASLVLASGLTAIAAQPNMESALTALRSARRSLIEATANKGGHRANAIKLIDQAIEEVQAGIEMH
jgi:hypothetical protein